MKKILFLFLSSTFLALHAVGQELPTYKLHSHNDYLRTVPFWDAFGAGCASIEVDVILRNGSLMAAHEAENIRPERTLKSLYLEPIQKAKSLGMIADFDFHLLIDCKTEAYTTLDQIVKDASEFEEFLFSPKNPTGLKLIISGNRPKPEDYKNYPTYVFFDYQSKVLSPDLPWEKIGMVSLSFRQFSVWNGKGRIVQSERDSLVSFISKVHSFDKAVRFWASPDSKSAWKAFADLGIDYINTDQPYEANQYLKNLESNIFVGTQLHEIYKPEFDHDGKENKIERVILMIGDGNGLAQISAGMFANGNQLNLTQLKNIGFVKTQAADDFTTDSAAGATAYATGQKTNNRALGTDPKGKTLQNITELLDSYDFNSGIITTDNLTGATPASFYAHHSERDDIDEIARFLPLSKLDLFIGGGKRDFIQFGTDRLKELEENGFTMMKSLGEIADSPSDKVGYFASNSGMPTMAKGREDYLLNSCQEAISFLKSKKSPFFLMVEAAMIDSGGHANNSNTIVTELLDFDKAIGWMIHYVDQNPNTLLIITADHETAGLSLPQGKVSENEVELAFHSDDHTGIMVPIFAYGAHSGEFRGVYENTEVFHKIMSLVNQYHQAK
ncbi:alkaline phosphatase [Aquiflexum gelatinilyticum]|uniref:alkaline phosphatase n=1 Tax=Aquiflexum gelatinilyticum TaxID=2961943 RepID=UPI0021694451|nr:alkaline phosphatase [Aquiflexum gelatinilyticum]MCS4436658.1 alkaline phosphatase [Aquiflexum gelatinilyticum]